MVLIFKDYKEYYAVKNKLPVGTRLVAYDMKRRYPTHQEIFEIIADPTDDSLKTDFLIENSAD